MKRSVIKDNRPSSLFPCLWVRMPIALGLLLASPLAIASREGAGIGEGFALLIFGVLALVLTVIVIAVVSGIVIGRRRGAVARQIGRHLSYGLIFLLVAPIVAAAVAAMWNTFQVAEAERDAEKIKAWLAPLEHPATGGVDQALHQILQAEQADTRSRRIYLIAAFPDLLQRIEIPLNEQDRAAIRSAASLLRSENTQRNLGSHPHNLDRIDGTVAWLLAKPNLTAALQECGQDKQACTAEVLSDADAWCYHHPDVCHAELDTAHLDAAEAWVKHDQYLLQKLQGLRWRAANSGK